MSTDKILVVDDDQSILDEVCTFLEGWDYGVSPAQSIAEAKALWAQDEYAVLLTEMVLPDGQGLELAQYVESACPEVVVTFIGKIEDRETAKVLMDRAYACLSKPLHSYELLLVVQNSLHYRQQELKNKIYIDQLESKVHQCTQELEQTLGKLRESEQERQDNEEKFKLLSENSNDGILIHYKNKILYLNAKMVETIGGQRPEDFVGQDISSYIHPDDRERVLEINSRRAKGLPVPDRYEFKGVSLDGSEIDLEISVAQTTYQNLPVTVGFFRNITSQKADRKALEDSEKRLRTILKAVQAGILVVDKRTRIIALANPAALDMIGMTEEEVIGRACCNLVCPAGEERCPVIDCGHEIDKREMTILTADGNEVQVLKTIVPLTIQAREYILESFVDISPLKKVEADLAQTCTDLENLLSSISSILIQISPSGRICRWNRQAVQLFDLQQAEVWDKSLYDLPLSWDQESLYQAVIKCREKHSPVQGWIIGYQRKEGDKGFLDFSVFPYYDEYGVFSGLLLLGTDITERKNLEAQLLQAQKMESIGQLAAGIAHEINTPIQYVGDNTRFMQEAFAEVSQVLEKCSLLVSKFEAAENLTATIQDIGRILEECDFEFLQAEVPQAIEQTLQGVEQVAAIVRSMKDFSHPGGEEKIPVDINKALQSTGTISRNEWKYVAHLEFDLEDYLPMVPCLPGEMNQVFLNVIVNAAQAIADVVEGREGTKGTITVTTRSDAHGVEIRIADTGSGIPEKDRPYIFNPFFTTKDVGKGTGQGLALAYATVVDKHGGSLSFETEEGRGTIFVVRLPLHTRDSIRSGNRAR